MRQILKTYNLELKVQGPVFVGNGEEIQKKEYVFLNGRHALGVVDIQKLYQLAKKKGLAYGAGYKDNAETVGGRPQNKA